MKKINPLLSFLFLCLISVTCSIKGQTSFKGLGIDKNENKYIVGTFDQVINFGNKTVLSSSGESDIFIGKYNSTGICQWATKIGGKNDEGIGGIYVEPNGNFFVTGYITGVVKFGEIKRSVSGNKFFIAKYNTSGDPIWIKISGNKGNNSANYLVPDNKGNLYVIGSFDNSLVIDGQSVVSSGKMDIFVLKINSSGNTVWLKNYGGKDDDYGETIFATGNKVVIGGNKKIDASNYVGYLAEISSESGNVRWDKTIGTKKGTVEKITVDNSFSYLVTGSVENISPESESTNLFISKVSPEDGKDIWFKRYNGNNAKGTGIVCDSKGNTFVSGIYSDSLRLGANYLGGFSSDDIFLTKITSSGTVLSAKSYGTNKMDATKILMLYKENLFMGGTFTDKIVFGKKELIGRNNTVFLSYFDIQKSLFTDANIFIQEDPNYESDSKINTISGKLLIGAGSDKAFLNDQALFLEDDNGNFIKTTVTDENGDFSFKNIDVSTNVNLVIEKNEKIKETDEIYLAQQNGVIVQKLEMEKGFKFKLLPSTMVKLEPIEEVDAVLVLKDFKISSDKEFTLIERILYEPNSYTIPIENLGELNQIAAFLKQNPKMKIEIFSHTDSNGDEASNLILSEKRATEVRNYLIKKQIQSERIWAKGFGESQIINRCINNVKCTENEHSYNRRTEFKFIKGNGL